DANETPVSYESHPVRVYGIYLDQLTSAPAQARENDTEGLASQRRNIHHRRTSGGPMPHYRYLIVGAGMTGDAAVRGIREIDSSGPIGVIGAEPHPPYNRPPLSKGRWKDQSLEQICRGTGSRDV